MSILINKNTKVITQGITGKTGQFHTEKCQELENILLTIDHNIRQLQDDMRKTATYDELMTLEKN